MGDRRKLLLAVIAFTALYHKVTADKAKLLDMAPDAVDDMYNGCREEAMEKFIHSGLLKQELNHSREFQKAWNLDVLCLKLIPGGIKEHTAALNAYVDDEHLKKTFNNAVETLGVNVSIYEDHFHFKSLHFLLMDSIWLLNPKECKTVYVSPETQYTAKKGSEVRFGMFTVVYTSIKELMKLTDLEGEVVFKIFTCFFVNLGEICSDNDNMALISPAEVFTVEEVKMNKEEYTEITLKHLKRESSHNCYTFSRSPADVSTQWLVLMLVASSLFFYNC